MLLFRCWLDSVYFAVRVFCFLDAFVPQTMPSLEGTKLQNYLVTTCYFIILGWGYHNAFQQGFACNGWQ